MWSVRLQSLSLCLSRQRKLLQLRFELGETLLAGFVLRQLEIDLGDATVEEVQVVFEALALVRGATGHEGHHGHRQDPSLHVPPSRVIPRTEDSAARGAPALPAAIIAATMPGTVHLVVTAGLGGTENGLTIYGNRFENFRKQKFSKMTEGPLVIQVDTSGGGTIDTLFVRSSTMEAYQDSSERLVAIDSVRITRGELAAEAGLSTFYTGLDSMVLLKSPVIWYATAPGDEHQVSGDSIFIKMQNRKVRTAYVRGDAMAISRADSLYHDRFNQMTGQEIVMQFVKNKLQSIDVDRTATSLYFLFDEGKGNGVNKSTGDHVAITFLDGRIDAIKVIGGTEGQYFPEKMVARHEGDYNLAGFNWRPRTPASVRRAR